MDVPIRVVDNQGNPVTNLVKANVTLRDPDNSATIYDYDDLSAHLGLGIYVIWGCDFSERAVRLWINNVEQVWFGAQYAGVAALAYVTLDTNQTIAALKTFTKSPIISEAADADTKAMRKGEYDAGLATCVKNNAGQTLTNAFVFNETCPSSGVSPTSDAHLVRKDYADALVPYLSFYGKILANIVPANSTLETLENSLGGNLTLTRSAAGVYDLASNNLFNYDTDNSRCYTTVLLTFSTISAAYIASWQWISKSLIKIYFYDDAGAASDAFGVCDIEIKTFTVPTGT